MTDYSIFFIIAVVATGVGALLFLLSLFGLGEHDLDFDADSGGADVGLLSIKSGIGFFLGFGWGGVLAQGLDWGMAASLAAAFFTGVLMFLIIGISMRFIMSLKSDGTLNYETLKGMTGSVYISIPGNLQRGGQVTIAHPSQLLYLPAVQEGEHPLLSATNAENQQIAKQTPSFAPKNVKSGVFVLFKIIQPLHNKRVAILKESDEKRLIFIYPFTLIFQDFTSS